MAQKTCKSYRAVPNGKSVRCKSFVAKDGFCMQHHPDRKLAVHNARVQRAGKQLAAALEQQTNLLQSMSRGLQRPILHPLSFMMSPARAHQ